MVLKLTGDPKTGRLKPVWRGRPWKGDAPLTKKVSFRLTAEDYQSLQEAGGIEYLRKAIRLRKAFEAAKEVADSASEDWYWHVDEEAVIAYHAEVSRLS